MLINQEFINHPTPAEVSFFRIGIEKLYKEKGKPDTTNYTGSLPMMGCSLDLSASRSVMKKWTIQA